MKIAVDYDDTYTADPILWAGFIKHAIERGHEVKFVTYRLPFRGNNDIESDSEALAIDIIYTSGKQKAHCWKADIWIDDSPECIVDYHKLKSMVAGCEISGDFS